MGTSALGDPDPSRTTRDDEEETWADAVEENSGETPAPSQDGGEVHALPIGGLERVASRDGDAGSAKNQEVLGSDIATDGTHSSRARSADRRREIRNGKKVVFSAQLEESTAAEQSACEVSATVDLLTNTALLVKACANKAAPRGFLLETAAGLLEKALQNIQAAFDAEGEGVGDLPSEQQPHEYNSPRFQSKYLRRRITGQSGPSMRPPVDDRENVYYARSNDHGTYSDSDEEEGSDEEYEYEDEDEDEEDEATQSWFRETTPTIPPSVDMPAETSGVSASQLTEGRNRTPQIKKELDRRFDECPVVRMLDTEMDRDSGYTITAYYERLPEINRNDAVRNGAPVDSAVLVEESQEDEHQGEGQQDRPEEPDATSEQQAQKPAVALKIGSPILLDVIASLVNFEIPQPCVYVSPVLVTLYPRWSIC
jgi:hypothetical protein